MQQALAAQVFRIVEQREERLRRNGARLVGGIVQTGQRGGLLVSAQAQDRLLARIPLRIAEHHLVFGIRRERHFGNHLRGILLGLFVVAHVEVHACQQGPACTVRDVVDLLSPGPGIPLGKELPGVSEVFEDLRVGGFQRRACDRGVERQRLCGGRDAHMRRIVRVGVVLGVDLAELQEHERPDKIGFPENPVDLLRVVGIRLLQPGPEMEDVVGVGHHVVGRLPQQPRISCVVLGKGLEFEDVGLELRSVGRQIHQVAGQIRIVHVVVVVVERLAVESVQGTFQPRKFGEETLGRAFPDVVHLEELAASGRPGQQQRKRQYVVVSCHNRHCQKVAERLIE